MGLATGLQIAKTSLEAVSEAYEYLANARKQNCIKIIILEALKTANITSLVRTYANKEFYKNVSKCELGSLDQTEIVPSGLSLAYTLTLAKPLSVEFE